MRRGTRPTRVAPGRFAALAVFALRVSASRLCAHVRGALTGSRGGGGNNRMRLDRLLQFVDRAIELRILARELGRDILLDDDVGIDAVAFDDVLAFGARRRELRHEHFAAVDRPAPSR